LDAEIFFCHLSDFCEGLVYGCHGVKICGAVVAFPDASAAVGCVVGVDDLEPCGEGEVFEDFAEAPAGDPGDAVNIACEPAGAV
jgi:hypothetical protein